MRFKTDEKGNLEVIDEALGKVYDSLTDKGKVVGNDSLGNSMEADSIFEDKVIAFVEDILKKTKTRPDAVLRVRLLGDRGDMIFLSLEFPYNRVFHSDNIKSLLKPKEFQSMSARDREGGFLEFVYNKKIN